MHAFNLRSVSGYIISWSMWCQLGEPKNIARACNNNILKIAPSELHTVGTSPVQNYFSLCALLNILNIYDGLRNELMSTVTYQCSISKAAHQQVPVYFARGREATWSYWGYSYSCLPLLINASLSSVFSICKSSVRCWEIDRSLAEI